MPERGRSRKYTGAVVNWRGNLLGRDGLALAAAVSIGVSALVLFYGYLRVRRGDEAGHHRWMLAASGLALLFLVLYLTKSALYPAQHYAGPPDGRPFYLGLLFFHMAIAGLNLPLAAVTLFWAFTGRRQRHRSWARVTLINWLLVALTGWAVYLVLARWGE